MQTLRKKTSPCKYRNDPAKFFGDGVTFKAKLIGILEVGEARGDRMCQEALQDLKMAIRAAGEHKQRITIHVTIDGLRLRDEKTGDSLYHHPVHKISFIAQDMTDSRAFGYIFGSPDSGHRFFGIKTDKAASQVVLAMRDLFQVVFELKKKEIELARQHIQSKSIHEHTPVTFTVKSNTNLDTTSSSTSNKASAIELGATKSGVKQISPESVADLVDLEQELSSIQRGITQMERITPNEPTAKTVHDPEDPFGDSFTTFPAYNIAPPPESSKSRHSKPLKPPEEIPIPLETSSTSSILQKAQNIPSSNDDWLNVTTTQATSALTFDEVTALADQNDTEHNIRRPDSESNGVTNNTTATTTSATSSATNIKFVDAFTDLDPLGTGKNKPYVDKKYFFHDLKNPPKKVLKDLSGKDSSFTANFSTSPNSGGIHKSDDPSSKSSDKLCDIDLKIFESSLITGTEKSVQRENIVKVSDEPIGLLADTIKHVPIDPFLDDDDFSKITIDPFEFEFNSKRSGPPESKITASEDSSGKEDKSVFNGPLQVTLPPENWTNQSNQKKLERQTSEINSPTFQPASMSASRNRPSVFKQNTVDVISSISSKKMKPHLFGQKFSKRDSNSINMRRLQESDSLSENETAPEPPPRPDSGSHIEPPPLPPKKQFSDIIIRPSPRGNSMNSATRDSSVRYDFLSSSTKISKNQNENAPPLPLPSRKIGKSETSYPGPGRPSKKLNEEDDYLTPLDSSAATNLPILLPPPQQKQGCKTRQTRKLESSDSLKTAESMETKSTDLSETSIPDITLSQLLTLGIDDLAKKLNVQTSKLNTMTLVELTTYLSDFIENSKKKPAPAAVEIPKESPVFKVNFSHANDSTFIAKFDDNFGEDNTFVANFDNFDMKADSDTYQAPASNGTTDKYAVFREIIEQEISNSETEIFETPLSSLTMVDDKELPIDETPEKNEDIPPLFIPPVLPKIDTKITEAISQAKDRYAALRDIILVEDLFDKNPSPIMQSVVAKSTTLLNDITNDSPKPVEEFEDEKDESPIEICDSAGNSPEINIFPDEDDQNLETIQNVPPKDTTKDDLEIDEYMQRAISNLSLDSRDHLSPISTSKSPTITTNIPQSLLQNASTSPIRTPAPMDTHYEESEILTKSPKDEKIRVMDMSTSPIPIPLPRSPISVSPASKSPIRKEPAEITTQLHVAELSVDEIRVSPEVIKKSVKLASEPPAADLTNESWAVFDKQTIAPAVTQSVTIKTKSPNKDDGESPCSSDGKDEWKSAQDYSRRWPNGQTSSSSRDVSPWDEDGPEYRRRYHPPDKLGHHVRHTTRRMNSCDEEYDFDDKLARRKDRRIKGPMNRSRENFESENWYHLNEQNNWSPPEDDDRQFDRSSYERSTYGPPYDKRDHKNIPYDHKGYEKRDHKAYDKRKYHREYSRPDYDFDRRGNNYFEDEYDRRGRPQPPRKEYSDELFEASFDRESRDSHSSRKTNRDYFYERDKRSFDRESIESYESGRGGGRRSFGSGEIYGSLDSRGEFRDRDRHLADKSRSWRKGMRTTCPDEEYEQDSEGDVTRRVPGDTRSLQRPVTSRPRMSSGSSPWDGEDLTPTSATSKSWKRPASASESERRLAENKRILCNTLSGSDSEKDRRFRKKSRQRNEKEVDNRMPNYSSLRYPRRRGEDYFEFDDSQLPPAPPTQKGAPPMIDPYFPSGDEETKPRATDNIERQYYIKREQFFKNLTPRSENRTMSESLRHGSYDKEFDRRKQSPRENYGFRDRKFDEPVKTPVGSGGSVVPPSSATTCKHVRMDYEFDEFEDTPRSTTSSKFNFEEEQGFESDFNSPPASGNEFRFSNDFSEKESSPRIQPPQPGATTAPKHTQKSANYLFDAEFPSSSSSLAGGTGGGSSGGNGVAVVAPIASKLRFDDNVTVSQFNNDAILQSQMFEDDFAKAEFTFEDEDKWNELPSVQSSAGGNGLSSKVSSKLSKMAGAGGSKFDYIKKSESVNIFAKKVDDPFEDDDFFKSSGGNSNNNNHHQHHNNGGGGSSSNNNNNNDKNNKHDPFQWEKNFAKFDDI